MSAVINNTKHFAIAGTSTLIQDALNTGSLENPYVALVDGELDYNSMEPERPCVIGEWSDDGAGHYTFQILDTGNTAWEDGVNIGSLADVYFNGDGPINMDVIFGFDGIYWTLDFVPEGGDPSDGESYSFTEGNPDTWISNTMTDSGASTSPVSVDWDGTDTFVFTASEDYPLSLDTINPECSPSE